MNDLAVISTQLWALFRSGAVPEELSAGGALRYPLDDGRGIQLRLQPQPPRWLLGVDQMIDPLDEAHRARCHEALLRTAHATRWTAQQVGALDAKGCASLVDCDYPGLPEQAAAIADAAQIEGRLCALMQQLAALCDPAHASGVDTPGVDTPASEPGSTTQPWLKA